MGSIPSYSSGFDKEYETPSPFREKNLDPNATEFIVSWPREVSRDAQVALLVYLDRPTGLPSLATREERSARRKEGRDARAFKRLGHVVSDKDHRHVELTMDAVELSRWNGHRRS